MTDAPIDVMTKATEERLKSLLDKRASLDEQIKKIQAEKNKQARKVKAKKEQVVGKMIFKLVRSGEWSEEQLTDLLDEYLTSKIDRQLFGLDVPEPSDKNKSAKFSKPNAPENQSANIHPPEAKTGQFAPAETSKAIVTKPQEAAKSNLGKSPSEHRHTETAKMPNGLTQENLENEFNF